MGVVKREVKIENDDDMDEGADIFSSQVTNDDDDDSMDAEKDTVKAALKTGMLGKGVAEEEERMAAENKRSAGVIIRLVGENTFC